MSQPPDIVAAEPDLLRAADGFLKYLKAVDAFTKISKDPAIMVPLLLWANLLAEAIRRAEGNHDAQ